MHILYQTHQSNRRLYQPTPFVRSTPIVLPTLSTIASPTAPTPPPPKISILGGPHLNALTSQSVVLDGNFPAASPRGCLNIYCLSIKSIAPSTISLSDGTSKNPAKSSICD